MSSSRVSFASAAGAPRLRLEPIFWAALEEIADERGQAVDELLRDIVPPPPPRNLTSRVRVAILAQYWSADNNPRLA